MTACYHRLQTPVLILKRLFAVLHDSDITLINMFCSSVFDCFCILNVGICRSRRRPGKPDHVCSQSQSHSNQVCRENIRFDRFFFYLQVNRHRVGLLHFIFQTETKFFSQTKPFLFRLVNFHFTGVHFQSFVGRRHAAAWSRIQASSRVALSCFQEN